MNKERLHIVLNKDIIDQLNLASGQELEAELYADKLVLQREEEPERRTLSSWVLIIATVLLSVIFFGHAASVHPEPGSNSPLSFYLFRQLWSV